MISKEKKEQIINLRKEGYTIPEISKIVKVSIASVSDNCKKFDPDGEFNFHYIKKEIKDNIIEDAKKGLNIKELCVKYKGKITRHSIRNYLLDANIISLRNKLSPEEYKRQRSLNVINWKRDKKLKLIKYKGGKCERCGYDKCYKALEFHHLDPNEKDFSISTNSYSFDRMKEEVDKCMLVCANCHREIHHELLLKG